MWRRADEGDGHSFARLARVAGGWRAHGAEVVLIDGRAMTCAFRVDLDDAWITRSVEVSAVDTDGDRAVELRSDPARTWTVDGSARPDLDGCLDVDIAATPLTNTFPIRRLTALPVGGTSTSPVAWVEVPSLRVARVDQTYRRLGERRWEYSDPTHGAFALDVDEAGVVTTYEGFALRV